MSVFELNVKDYIKRQTSNIVFEYDDNLYYLSLLKTNKPNYINFNDFYKLYNDFKKLGRDTYQSQDGIINKVKIDGKIIVTWPLIKNNNLTLESNIHLTNFLNGKYNFNNKKMGLDNVNSSQIISFAQLIYLCTDAIKDYCTCDFSPEEISNATKKFEKIIQIPNKNIEIYFDEEDALSVISEIISRVEEINPDLSQIKEILKYDTVYNIIEPFIQYSNCLSVFFHFFKLEIVYYSFIRDENKKKPKLCAKCGKYSIGKCKCLTIDSGYRRNQNKKCQTIRKKLSWYIEEYPNIISENLYRKSIRMLEDNHHWQDFKELERLCTSIEQQLKETNKN